MSATLQNWAGNRTFSPSRFHEPETVEQIQEIVANSRKIRATGTRHSFNDIADSPEDLLSCLRLTQIGDVDPINQTVRIGPGVTYGVLCANLAAQGFTVRNLASLPHISVAGACATATHGSGDRNGNLATAVRELEIVAADGRLITLTRDLHPEFFGAVVSLGALGVVVSLKLEIVPLFEISQSVYENLALSILGSHFEEVFGAAYSVSLFTSWREPAFDQVWVKSLTAKSVECASEFFGAKRAPENRHPIPGVSAENCTPQMGVAGASYERLPHFRMEFTPSNGDELQTEYIVPRRHAYEALCAVSALRHKIAPLLHVSEIRSIAADELWLSPCYNQPGIGIHFTWKKNWPAVQALLPTIEEALAPFGARPHWGKLFTMAPERVRSLYTKLPDFIGLATRLDPSGKFCNEFVSRVIRW